MKVGEKAEFKFETYKIVNFSYDNPKQVVDNVNIEFSPSGIYNQGNGKYLLRLSFTAFYKDGATISKFLEQTTESTFQFVEPLQFKEIPDFFFSNSIAIVFPYIRAFATSLTALANVKPLILPLMNLTALGEELKENTQSITQ